MLLTRRPNAGDDPSGVYRGQMCYAAGGATEPAHCFEAQAVVMGNRISGEWLVAILASRYILRVKSLEPAKWRSTCDGRRV